MAEDKVASLQKELKETRQKLSRTEQQLQKSQSYNEDLRQQIESISSELHTFRSSLQNRKEAACQVADKDISQAYGEKPFPNWSTTDNGEHEQGAEGQTESATSIADSLKAAAEEFAWKESGFVYDSSSGLYYDYNSGYYYDPVNSLYYDPSTTAYYYYDEAEQVHKFHSYATGQYDQQSSKGDKESSTTAEGVQTGASGQQEKKEKRNDRHKSRRQEDKEKRKVQKRTNLVSRRKKSSKHKSKTREKKKHKKKDVERGSKDSNSKSIIVKDSDSEERTEEMCGVKDMCEVIEVDSSDSLATGESEMLSDPESGELSDQTSEDEESKTEEETEIGGEPVLYRLTDEHISEPEVSASYPPCVRVIVQESDTLEAGTFFLVTCPGGTVGRDKDPGHAIQIQELNVSKIHAEIMYDYDNNCYTVKDMGSQNGTFINGLRICESKEKSAAVPVDHDDTLQVGSTKMLLHIHQGSETCDRCEPGQVLAALRAQQTVTKEHVILTNAEKKKQAQEQLKNIKKKYGLGNSAYVDNVAAIKNPNYADKADLRRRFIGSTHTSHIKAEAPASVHRPISSENKGHRMLSKMGWEEGSGLGKDNTGRAEPVAVELRANQTAGFGSPASVGVSLDNVHSADKTRRRLQTQARYQKLENAGVQQTTEGKANTPAAAAGGVSEIGKTQPSSSPSGQLAKYQMKWVKGDSWKSP